MENHLFEWVDQVLMANFNSTLLVYRSPSFSRPGHRPKPGASRPHGSQHLYSLVIPDVTPGNYSVQETAARPRGLLFFVSEHGAQMRTMVLEYLPTFTYVHLHLPEKRPSFVGKYSSTMEHLGWVDLPMLKKGGS